MVPLLMDTIWASEDDLVLAPEILGYAALAPIWAGDHVLVEQAVELVDVLSEERLDTVSRAYDAFFAGEALRDPGGPLVLSDPDPRIAAHAAIADDLRALYAPWAMLHVDDELGPVVAHQRAELDLAPDEFGVEAKTWLAFEASEADPYTEISAPIMARAIRKLGFVESIRVLDLAEASVRSHHEDDDVTAGHALARRRRGASHRSRRRPQAVDEAAQRYREALAKELGL
jgi:hypothetical protein